MFFYKVSNNKHLLKEIINIKKRIKQAILMGLKVYINIDNSNSKILVICASKVWVYNRYFGI